MTNDGADNLGDGVFSASGVVKSVRVYLPAVGLFRSLNLVRSFVLLWLMKDHQGEYGLMNLALLWVSSLSPLVSVGLTEAITRYVPVYQTQNRVRSFLAFACILVLGIGVVFTAGLLTFHQPLGRVMFGPGAFGPLAVAIFLSTLAIVAYFMMVSILKGLRMYTALSLMELFHGLVYFILTIAVVLFIKPTATVVIWAYLAALLAPTLIWGIILLGKLPRDAERTGQWTPSETARQLMVYGFWAALSGGLWCMWQMYSLWHLKKLPDQELAIDAFSASRLLGQLILIFGISVAGVVMTNVCAIWEKDRRAAAFFLLDMYAKGAILALLLVSAMMIVFRQPLMLVIPAKYIKVMEILPGTLLYFQFLTVLSFLSIRFVLEEKMHQMPLAWGVGLAANAVLGYTWIVPERALGGAVDAAAWSCVPATLLAIALIRRQGQPISFGLWAVITASFLLLLSGWVAVVGTVALMLWALVGNSIFTDRQRALIIERILSRRVK